MYVKINYIKLTTQNVPSRYIGNDKERILAIHIDLTEMCIISAPYFHQKHANQALKMMLFKDAVGLLLLTKFFQNSSIRRYRSGINFLNYNAKLAPNLLLFVLNSTKK